MKEKLFLLGVICLLLPLLTSCDSVNEVEVSKPEISLLVASKNLIEVGGIIELTCIAGDKNGEVNYEWISTDGEFIGNGSNIKWIAPNAIGTFTITCKVTNQQNESVSSEIIITTKNSLIFFYNGDTVYSVNTDGSDYTTVTDGSYIFFYDENTLMVRNYSHQLKKIDLASKSTETLYTFPTITCFHKKIPNQNKIVFYTIDYGERDLAILDLNTNKFSYLLKKSEIQAHPTPNTDGWIYYLERTNVSDSEYSLYRISLNGTIDQSFKISDTGYSYGVFSFTYDGKTLYAPKNGNGKAYISKINMGTLNEELLEINGIGSISYVHISKDEDYILFVGINGSDRNLYKINADGTNLTKLTNVSNSLIAGPVTW